MILFSQQLTLTHNNKVVYHVLVSQKGNRHKRKNKDTEIIKLSCTSVNYFHKTAETNVIKNYFPSILP